MLEAIEFADEVGLDRFRVGEHTCGRWPLSSPTTVVNAGTASTRRIELSTAVSVPSTPSASSSRATAAAIAPGHIETVAGHG
ncbi:hypothetical protein OG342_00545 [Streptomyces bobili]|uniref:hypothetical protein n=1 Tax=Streptomyces TaxID=1883 RepID=UPI0022520EB7|nr:MULTISPECIES: hypothetical protein [Streptomyces]MCX5521384.1 hypothetical protein [Streptomyces bobili]MDX3573349.1 hypothetical protein [Streptomyces sp. ID05-47C]